MEQREGPVASREGFTADKRALFSLLLTREGLSGPADERVTRRRTNGPIPLSFPQQRLWLNERLAPSAAYNVAAVLRLDGVLRVDALERAVNELFHRHESLRTTFVVEGDSPVQVIQPPIPISVPIVDLRSFPLFDREAEAERLATAEAREPFDLARGPLLRVSVLQLDDKRHRLLITMHHIVSDGWSTAVFVRELTALYGLAVQGKPVRLDDPPLQYADFALWQRERLTTDVLDGQLAFWRQQLAGAPPLIPLPVDRARPATLSSRGSLHRFTWPRGLLDDVRAFSRHEEVTVFMTLLTAFQILLHRYSGETDLLIGTPIANRSRPELEGIIGFFVNTLVMRGDLSGDPTFRDLLQRTRDGCLSAYSHQDLPFERLVEALAPPRDRAYTPVFQVMFVLQNAPVAKIVLPDLEVTVDDGDTASTAFDLTLSLQEREDGLVGSFEYATDLFEESSIARMVGHLEALLRDGLARPRQRISGLQFLTPPERHQLVEEWNATRQVFLVNRPVHHLFEDQVERTPDRVAVLFGEEQLTYRELNSRANQLAHYLQGFGVGPETVVGICIERSLEMVVGLLGVLKAGGAYLPLEPSYPRERLAFMLEDANVPVLLCQDSLRGLPAANGARTIFLDTGWEEIARASDANPESGAAADNLAYVIYTSGSTGRPKGVMISHRALSNHMLWLQAQFPLSETDRVLQKTPFSFDASVWEFYAPLMAGARLVMARPGEHRDSASLVRTIADERITILQVVPTLLRLILDEAGVARLHCLRRVFCGGEPLPVELSERFFGLLDASLHNLYGPSEATIDATFWTCSPGDAERSVPIGRPVSNMRAYVLDRHLQPVPVGITGELYLAGDGLGRGYLNRPEPTAENFVPDPFGGEPGGRLYRTGDLARFLSDGRIEFLGRLDAQVKLRGQRIELGEIEARLREHSAVEDAVVVLQEEGANSRIVAYVVPARGTSLTPDALRSTLGEKLPAYMVPSTFVFLDALPITAVGKVDRRALGTAVAVGISSQPYAAPRGPTEEVLASIWMDVLRRERVGAHDNFFELGGHSLLAMRVLSRVQAAFAIDLPMVRLFEHPTVAGFARCVEAETTNEPRDVETQIVAVQGRESALLSVGQQHIWWTEQVIPDTPLFNMPFAFRISGALDVDSLYRSLDEVICRHEALRTKFTIVDAGPVQTVTSCKPLDRVIVDLSGFTGPEQEREVEEWARKNAYRPFDLTAGVLVRATVLRLAETEHVAFVTIHHIAADAWSIAILVRELALLYEAFHSNRSLSLPEVTLQYPDYAHWQRAQLLGERFRAGLDYWTGRLGDAPVQTLPTDRPRPPELTFDTAVVPLALGAEATRDLHQLSRSLGSSLFMLLLAAFKLSIYRWTGFSDLRVATLTANRQRRELEGVIGCFANMIVLRTDLSGNPTFQELVKRVRQAVLDAQTYQDVPFELMIRTLGTHREVKGSNLVNIEFDWQEAPTALAIPGLETRPLRNDNRMADLGLALTTSELVMSLSVRPEGISGSLIYKTALFDAETVKGLGIDFHDVVRNVAQQSQKRLLEFLPQKGRADELLR